MLSFSIDKCNSTTSECASDEEIKALLDKTRIKLVFNKGLFDYNSRDEPIKYIIDDSLQFGLSGDLCKSSIIYVRENMHKREVSPLLFWYADEERFIQVKRYESGLSG